MFSRKTYNRISQFCHGYVIGTMSWYLLEQYLNATLLHSDMVVFGLAIVAAVVAADAQFKAESMVHRVGDVDIYDLTAESPRL